MTKGHTWLVTLVVAVAALLLGALSGCRADVGSQLQVGSDGAGTIGVRLSVDREVQGLLEEQAPGGVDTLFDEFLAAVPAGWAAEQGSGADGVRWVSARRPFADLAQLEQLVATAPAFAGGGPAALGLTGIEVRQHTGLFWITTNFRGRVQSETLAARIADEGLTDLDPSALEGVVHIEERVSLPGYARSHNAQAREGGALVWRFDPGGSGDLLAESIAPRWVVVGPGLGVLGLLLVPVGTVGLVRWRSARRRSRRARERRRQVRLE